VGDNDQGVPATKVLRVLDDGRSDALTDLRSGLPVAAGWHIGTVAPGLPQFTVSFGQVGVALAFPLPAVRLAQAHVCEQF
jgi:hypothetical protein